MNKTVRDAIHRVFEGSPPESFEFMGVEHYSPQDVGMALGYGDDGGDIAPWLTEQAAAGEIAQGEHLVRLGRRPDSPVVLTERGLFRVLVLCPKSKAAEFRDWLDEELAGEGARPRKTSPQDSPMQGFADECLKREDGAYTLTGDVHAAHCAWCDAHGVKPVTQRALSCWLLTHGWRQDRSRRHGRRWENMRLCGA